MNLHSERKMISLLVFRNSSYKQNRIDIYQQKESTIKELLASVPSSEEIEKMLSLLELDIQDFYTEYGEEKIKDAILYAKDLKDRYSVLWLNYDLFGDRIKN